MFCFPMSVRDGRDSAGREQTLDIDVPYPILKPSNSNLSGLGAKRQKILYAVVIVQVVEDEAWLVSCWQFRNQRAVPEERLNLIHAHVYDSAKLSAKGSVVEWK